MTTDLIFPEINESDPEYSCHLCGEPMHWRENNSCFDCENCETSTSLWAVQNDRCGTYEDWATLHYGARYV